MLPRSMIRFALIPCLAAALLMAGCVPDRPVSDGLLIGPEGEILPANAENVRRVRESRAGQAVADLLGVGWRVRVSIQQRPISWDRKEWFWPTMDAAVDILPPNAGDEMPKTAKEVSDVVMQLLTPWMRSGEPKLTMTLDGQELSIN